MTNKKIHFFRSGPLTLNGLSIKSNNFTELFSQVQIINRYILLYSMSSSLLDEIIEISDLSSSSSSDNSFSEPSGSAFVHTAIPVSPKTISNSTAVKTPSSSKSNKRYQCKFKKDWLSKSLFSTFLRECKGDSTKALCITCNVQFSVQNSGLGDVHHHIQTKRHKERTKAAEAVICKTFC